LADLVAGRIVARNMKASLRAVRRILEDEGADER
jgi:hypothetical protein